MEILFEFLINYPEVVEDNYLKDLFYEVIEQQLSFYNMVKTDKSITIHKLRDLIELIISIIK